MQANLADNASRIELRDRVIGRDPCVEPGKRYGGYACRVHPDRDLSPRLEVAPWDLNRRSRRREILAVGRERPETPWRAGHSDRRPRWIGRLSRRVGRDVAKDDRADLLRVAHPLLVVVCVVPRAQEARQCVEKHLLRAECRSRDDSTGCVRDHRLEATRPGCGVQLAGENNSLTCPFHLFRMSIYRL